MSQLLIYLEALQRQQLCLNDSPMLLSSHFILNPERLTNADGLVGIPWWFDGYAVLSLPRPRFNARELRTHKLHGTVKKKKKIDGLLNILSVNHQHLKDFIA